MDEQEPIHRSEIGDCETEAQNRAAGYRPSLRAEVLINPDDPDADTILHLCGTKHPLDIAQMIEFLSKELAKILSEATIETDENS